MKTPACQALLDASTRDTLHSAHSQGDDEFISQLYCRNFGLKFSKMKSIPFRYLLICSARNLYSEVAVCSSPNRYAMASVQFILKNVRNHTHPKQSLLTTLNHVSTVSVFSMSKHTHQFLLNTFMHYSSWKAQHLLVLRGLYKPLRNTSFLLHLLLSFTISSTVIKFLLCTGQCTALAACCLLNYLWKKHSDSMSNYIRLWVTKAPNF